MMFVVGSIYFSVKMNKRLDETFKEAQDKVNQASIECDSIARTNDSLTSVIQEDRIAIGRYEYMIELIRENLDSNKVDKILENVE